MMEVIVGTSGWMYKDWGERFYPEEVKLADRLKYFAEHFKTVEINSTFYRLPNESAVKNWHDSTPADFVFAVKLSRYLTHILRLESSDTMKGAFDNYVARVRHLKNKLGPVLVQLPGSFHADPDRIDNLAEITESIGKKNGVRLRLAFEFRHKSWFTDEVFTKLKNNNVAIVAASGPGRWPETKQITADFAYIRFHGDEKLYASSYSDKELDNWASYISTECKGCKQVYCYFNNDHSALAVENAKYLSAKFQ